MYKKKSVQNEQVEFHSPYVGMNPKRLKRLQESWAGVFKKEVYSKIDEEPFSVLFSEKASRPNVPVRLLLSALILKEIRGYTDEDLVNAIDFDIQVRFALDLDSSGEDELPFSTRTLTRFRTKIYEHEQETGVDLIYEAIKGLLDNFNEVLGTNPNLRRMDSFQIASNIKNLSRLGILYETTKVALKALDKDKVHIPEELAHYLEKYDSNQILYYDKTTPFDQKAKRLIEELEQTLELVKSSGDYKKEQALLERVKGEQLIEDEGKLRLKKGRDEGLNSQTLQSPYDPDATFRQKKGPHIGYVGNVEESVNEDGDSMLVDYQYEQNTHSDSAFMKEVIEKEEEHPKGEELTLVTDGAYGSVENTTLAEEKGIKHVPTELSGRKTDDFCADFIFSEDGTQILECPNGNKPLKCSYSQSTGQCRAVFDRSHCEGCPFSDKCHPKKQKKTMVKTLSVKSKQRAKTKREQKGESFSKLRNFRNGSEAVPAALRQKYNIDRMPVRGLIRTKQWFGLKIGALATVKLLRSKKCQKTPLGKCA